MKILEIVPNLNSGGGEKFTVDLTNALADAGHDCTIATLYDPNTNDILRSYIEPKVNTLSFSKRLGADFRCMLRISKYIRKHKPDIVHAQIHPAQIRPSPFFSLTPNCPLAKAFFLSPL